MNIRDKALLHGLLGGAGLLLVYLFIVSLAQSFGHAVEQFFSLSYLMVPLIAGFGTQVSLFSYSRQYASAIQGSTSVTASGGLSTVSMIACCAHHITNALPFIGATAAATFLTAYQTFFIQIGLLSNIVGITVMLAITQKYRLYNQQGAFARVMKLNLTRVRNLVFVVSIVAIIPVGWAAALSTGPTTSAQNELVSLPERVSNENGLTVVVAPQPLLLGSGVNFTIKMDTHSGDLNFDLTKSAYMTDSNGLTYSPTGWSGSPSGGHHREGVLTFPPLKGDPSSFVLTLKDIYGADRVFEWSLPVRVERR